MRIRRYFLCACFCFGMVTPFLAQDMEVTDPTPPPFTPENLITNVFLGTGVEILNVSFSGDPVSVGFFKNGLQEVGIDRGILMTSGKASSSMCNIPTPGANCPGNNFASFDNNSTATDPDLNAITSGTIFDVCKFTITFIPNADTLRFRYVFASEEYPEWACSPFNDVFGFFISGPGINGPYENNGINIARIPGTNMPVSINNVHLQNGPGCPASFPQYYHDNNGTTNQPVYDGFLSVFVAEAAVIPCETYTIKLMVTDVGDGIYDTGVFLEAKSFSANSLKVEAHTPSKDGTITEGCSKGSVSFTLPRPASSNYFLNYDFIGTATNGNDFETIPDGLFIPAGDTTLVVDIIPIADQIPESPESIGIDVQIDQCNRDTVWLFIKDNELMPPSLGQDTSICPGSTLSMDGTLPITLPGVLSFTNANDLQITDNSPTYSSIQVAGVQPANLGPGAIRSVCVNIEHPSAADLDLFLISPSGRFVELSTDNGANCDNYFNVCFSPTAPEPITAGAPWPSCADGVSAPFGNGTFQPEGIWADLWEGNNPVNGTWQLLVLDDEPGSNGNLLDWTITFEPFYRVQYEWSPMNGLSCADCPSIVATPNSTTTYVISATDNYGCSVRDSITISVNNVLPQPEVRCDFVSGNTIYFQWDSIPGASGYEVNVNNTGWLSPNGGPNAHLVSGLGLNTVVTFRVAVSNSCGQNIGSSTCSTLSCPSPTLTLMSKSDVSCPGENDGSMTVEAAGGSGNYTFQLAGQANMNGTFSNLSAGLHIAEVTDQVNCTNFLPVLIREPEALQLQTMILDEIDCFGENTASASVRVTGGSSPYNYKWDDVPGDSIAHNLAPGPHTIEVSDAKGCRKSTFIEIGEPVLLSVNSIIDSVDCFGENSGGAELMIAGGAPPYAIQWDAAASGNTATVVQDLAAGTYRVSITDAKGCQIIEAIHIPQPPELMALLSTPAIPCNGPAISSATVLPSGGQPPYQYIWSNGQSSPTATNLPPGLYGLTLTDSNNCQTIGQVAIDPPTQLQVALSQTPASCHNGTDGSAFIDLIQLDSQPVPFDSVSILWSWLNQNTPAINELTAGQSYSVTVTNSSGCSATAVISVGNPPLLSANISAIQHIRCFGERNAWVSIAGSGGTPPYHYAWNDGQTNDTLFQLSPGPFSATVTDAGTCTATVAGSIMEPEPMKVNFENTKALCYGAADGTSMASISGGTPPFQLNWSAGSNNNLAINLEAGFHYLTVTDGNGCQIWDSTEILQPVQPLSAAFKADAPTCSGLKNGKIVVAATGGSPPYNYSLNGSNPQSSPQIFGLAGGLYHLAVIDKNGCRFDTLNFELKDPPPITVNLGPDTVTFYGYHIHIHPTISGVANQDSLTYFWQSTSPQTPVNYPDWRVGDFVVLSQTTAALTVTDKNGCTGKDLINIFVREPRNVVVPTGFSPAAGGDPDNDMLHVHGSGFLVEKIRRFRIFDRWGELLYEARDFRVNDLNTGWDGTFRGKEMPAGVYVWFLEVDFKDGETESYKGHTTLIR